MSISQFYQKHKGKTNLKISQMNELKRYLKCNGKVKFLDLLDELKHLHFITREEYIDLGNLEDK